MNGKEEQNGRHREAQRKWQTQRSTGRMIDTEKLRENNRHREAQRE